MTNPQDTGQAVWNHQLSGGAHSSAAESAGTKLIHMDDRLQNIEKAVDNLGSLMQDIRDTQVQQQESAGQSE